MHCASFDLRHMGRRKQEAQPLHLDLSKFLQGNVHSGHLLQAAVFQNPFSGAVNVLSPIKIMTVPAVSFYKSFCSNLSYSAGGNIL